MSKNDRGLTLVELLISIVIMFIVFLGLTGTVLTGLEYNLRNAVLDEAVGVGESAMNQIRSRPFDNIVTPTAPDNVLRTVRRFNVTYTVRTTVTTPAADIKQVAMVVEWNRRGKSYNHVFSSIVRRRP